MENKPRSEQEIEQRLEAYFQAEADRLRAPTDLWAKLEPRLDKPSAAKRLISYWRARPLPAVAILATLFLLAAATWVFTATPWQVSPPAAPPGTIQPGATQAPAPMPAPTGTPRVVASSDAGEASGALSPAYTPLPTYTPRPPGVVPPLTPVPTPTSRPMPTTTPGFAPGATPTPASAGSLAPTSGGDWERMVIRNATLSLVVDNTARAVDQATQLARDMGGYVVSSRMWQDGKKVAGTIAIRVPAELFTDALRALKALAVEVVTEEVTSQDVTQEYVDLSSRLRSLEATEQQLLKVMEKATQVTEVLAVQRELTNVQGQIEQTKGRMQYLERSSATSLIQVTLREVGLDIAISASTKKARVGEEIKFSARVAGGFAPYSYLWDLGDGTTSAEEAPKHAYTQAGKSDVSLSITDDKGNTATLIIKELIVITPMETSSDISRTKARVGEEIKFNARVAGGFAPYAYLWDLGDDTTNTEEAIGHAYSHAGKFDISLSVTDDKGNTATVTKKELLTITPLETSFDISRTKARVGEEIRFNARIAGGFAPYAYLWDLGDGTTSTEEAPGYAYSRVGRFDVSLSITDDKGNSATETKKGLIAATPIEVHFEVSRTEVEAGQEIRFTSQIAGGFPPYAYSWDLGDGTASAERNPAHTYSQGGRYSVSLGVSDDKGNAATETRKQLIAVTTPPAWSAGEQAAGAIHALSAVGKGLVTGLIWMALLIPLWGFIIGVIVAVLIRRRRSA